MTWTSRRWALVALLALGAGEPEPQGDSGGEATPSPGPSLERFLRVPARDASPPSELRGGRDRRAWFDAFGKAEAEVSELEQRIAETQQVLRSRSVGDWGYTPQGASTPTDPEVLKLRADLRRDRQSLEAARARLRDLEVEASLAGVPEDWRLAAE
jgi:hypothetical protein